MAGPGATRGHEVAPGIVSRETSQPSRVGKVWLCARRCPMPVLPSTARRVEMNTDPVINHRIRRRTEESIHYYANHPEQIEKRLARLEREGGIERGLETNAAALGLTGSVV